jgi:hypothetical protein
MTEHAIDEGWEDVLSDREDEAGSDEIIDNQVSESESNPADEINEQEIDERNDFQEYQAAEYVIKHEKGKSYHILVLCLSLFLMSIGFYFQYKGNEKIKYRPSSSCSMNSVPSPPPEQAIPVKENLEEVFSASNGKWNGLKHPSKILRLLSSTVASFTSETKNLDKKPNVTAKKQNLIPKNHLNVTGTVYEVDMATAGGDQMKLATLLQEIKESKQATKISHAHEIVGWKALAWDYTNLIQYFGYLDQVLRLPAHQRVFLASTSADQIDSEERYAEHLQPAEGVLNYPLRDFLSKLSDDDGDKYFFSGNYRIIEELAHLGEDTSWKDLRVKEDVIIEGKISIKHPDPQLTMMYPQTVLQARMSDYHTIRVQLSGQGRYYTIAPEYARTLHPYPSIHAAASQAKVDLYGEDAISRYPLLQHAKAKLTVLEPGDVLYIPPYHYVHCEAGNQSLITYLDVLSPSIEQLIIAEASYLRTNFSVFDEGGSDEKIAAVQMYLVHIISRIDGLPPPKQYAASLYESRYASLYHSDSLAARKLDALLNCDIDDEVRMSKVVAKISKERLVALAEVVAGAFNDDAITLPLRWEYFGNYLETIISWAMQDLKTSMIGESDTERVALFLRRCMNVDKKLEVSSLTLWSVYLMAEADDVGGGGGGRTTSDQDQLRLRQ